MNNLVPKKVYLMTTEGSKLLLGVPEISHMSLMRMSAGLIVAPKRKCCSMATTFPLGFHDPIIYQVIQTEPTC